jgi:ferric-dicitrate binding protein FerR (iron transport regulator)
MKNIEYINLILRGVSGNSSSDETQKLEKLMSTDPIIRNEALLVENIWEACDLYEPGIHFNADAAFIKFKKEISVTQTPDPKIIELKSNFPTLLKYAASLLILAFAAYSVTTFIDRPEFETGEGQFKQIELADGSKLYLSGETMVNIDRKFAESNRNLEFEGKAFFDVVEDKNLPFIIDLDNKSLQVIGTSFNVINRGDGLIIVEVMTGEVLFITDTGTKDSATKNQSLVYNSTTGKITKKEILSDNTFNWSRKVLSFDNTPLDQVLSDLESYYEIHIDRNDFDTKDCFFTSPYLKDAPLTQTLDILRTTNGVQLIANELNAKEFILQQVSCK